MRTPLLFAATSALLAAALAPTGTARAACPCTPSFSDVVPRPGAENVPRNTRVTLYADRNSRAKDMAGTEFEVDSRVKIDIRIESTTMKVDGDTTRVQVPGITTMYTFVLPVTVGMDLLPEHTKLKVFAVDGNMKSHPISEFTTGGFRDDTAPDFGGITALDTSLDTIPRESSCFVSNPTSRASALVGPAVDQGTPAEVLRYELFFYLSTSQPPVSPNVVRLGAAGDAELVQSTAKCGLSSFTNLIPGSSYCARVQVVDSAGNSIGKANALCANVRKRTLDVDGNEVETKGGGGCRFGRGAAPGLGGLAALALAFLARRPRR